ncbi:MAG: DUF11 domain-containing protein, partial [Dinghuibacter sp.]|nr:DUF11 domain-containing protein [Dinghuibacter sp.]
MEVTADQGTIVAGTTTSNDGHVAGNHGAQDIWVVKTSAQGNIVWQKCIGGTGSETPTQMLLMNDGGIIITGYTNSVNGDFANNHGSTDGLVCKLNANGTLLWSVALGGSMEDSISGICKAIGGGYIVSGTTKSNDGNVSGNHGGDDTWVAKIDDNGALQWQRCYGGSGFDYPVRLISINQAGYLFCAATNSNNGDVTGNTAYKGTWCVRTDLNGNIVWQNTYGSDNQDIPLSILYTNNTCRLIRSRLVLFQLSAGGTPFINQRPHNRQFEEVLDISNGHVLEVRQINFDPTGDFSAGTYEAKVKQVMGGKYVILSNGHKCSNFVALANPPFFLLNKKVTSVSGAGGYFLETDTYVNNPCQTYPVNYTQNFYIGHDLASIGPNLNYICGTTNDPALSVNLAGTPDAFVAIGNGNSLLGGQVTLWGGTSDESFNLLRKIDDRSFYACGYTNSNSVHVSGNHGAQEIWLVKQGVKAGLNEITGNTYLDRNNNNVYDAGDTLIAKGTVSSLLQGAFTPTSSTPYFGRFSNTTDSGVHQTTLQLPSPMSAYYTVVPPARTSTFTGFLQKDSFDFKLVPVPGKNDLEASIAALTPARPGANITYQVNYRNIGSENIPNTQLKFIKDTRTSFVSATMPGATVTGDTISWNTGNLPPLFENKLNIVLQISTPPVIVNNDTLKTAVQISPVAGDETPNNNLFENRVIVRGSFDPNDKRNQHAGIAGKEYLMQGGHIYYTIRFQNTGNDTAFKVLVTDVLPFGYDLQSLELVASSHPCKTKGAISWEFDDILLPDSATNPEASQGYLTFRVKPQPAQIIVDRQFINKAEIYFDFNQSVVTNSDTITIKGVPKPAASFSGFNRCKNPGGLQKVKLLNPSPAYTVYALLNQTQTLPYSPSDSSIGINTATVNAGNHTLKVIYEAPGLGKDSNTFLFTIDTLIVPVVLNNDTAVCQYSPNIPLLANTTVSWTGTQVFSGTFHPSVQGTFIAIATRNNGTCPVAGDSVTIRVDGFRNAVIQNADTTVCSTSPPFPLLANTNVTWIGAGVSSNQFSAAVAGIGTHKILAILDNGACEPGRDSITIVVQDATPPVILTGNQTLCKTSSPISLLANIPVTWSGPGVSGNTFNPALAGTGTFQVIANSSSLCNATNTSDTVLFTVDDFVQAVISTPNQAVCKLSAPISLLANTNVSWVGTGVSGSTFNPATAG